MAPFTPFALIGAGTIGSFVTTELLKEKKHVRQSVDARRHEGFEEGAVERPSRVRHYLFATRLLLLAADRQIDAVVCADVCVVAINLSDASLHALRCSVSTITHFQMEAQVDIARAAKEAGVQLFVPSEYGGPSLEGFSAPKKVVRDALEEIQLPYTIFIPGYFADIFHTLTSRHDVARFITHVLTTAEPADLAWAKLPFEGDRLSPLEIAALVEEKLGKPITIKYHDYAETKATADTDVMAFLTLLVEDGNGLAGTTDEAQKTIAKYFPNWNPQKYDAFITSA
ncbi:Isoflavone reductase p3, partial [Globisporangium splendens]